MRVRPDPGGALVLMEGGHGRDALARGCIPRRDAEFVGHGDNAGRPPAMIRSIVGSSLKSRGLVVVLAAALLFFGFTQLRNVPVDVLPEFAPPTVEVQTEALGLSAAEVEELITVPLEQDLLNGVAWLDTIRSESIVGLSSIQMVFEPGTDLLRARQVVQERLSQAQVALPGVQSRPPQ